MYIDIELITRLYNNKKKATNIRIGIIQTVKHVTRFSGFAYLLEEVDLRPSVWPAEPLNSL